MPTPRTEHESWLKCLCCKGTPYRLLRVQNVDRDGKPLETWGYEVECRDGAPMPTSLTRMRCPKCDEPLQRVYG